MPTYSSISREGRQRLNQTSPAPVSKPKKANSLNWVFFTLFVAVMIGMGIFGFTHDKSLALTSHTVAVATSKPSSTSSSAKAVINMCAGNSLSKLVLVSISKRHLWACSGATILYNSPVVTGDRNYPSDLTPVGTYHIYAKMTNQTLTGSDPLGPWKDFVHYWMPFLYNQYGAYGLHDATWRTSNQFGHISPYSSNASHGCVELPLKTAAWLFNWTAVGTTVTVVN